MNKKKYEINYLKNKLKLVEDRLLDTAEEKELIDISDIYVFYNNGIIYLVRLDEEKTKVFDEWYPNCSIEIYNTKFINIFDNSIVYEVNSRYKIKDKYYCIEKNEYSNIYKLSYICNNIFPLFKKKEMSMDSLEIVYKRFNLKDLSDSNRNYENAYKYKVKRLKY